METPEDLDRPRRVADQDAGRHPDLRQRTPLVARRPPPGRVRLRQPRQRRRPDRPGHRPVPPPAPPARATSTRPPGRPTAAASSTVQDGAIHVMGRDGTADRAITAAARTPPPAVPRRHPPDLRPRRQPVHRQTRRVGGGLRPGRHAPDQRSPVAPLAMNRLMKWLWTAPSTHIRGRLRSTSGGPDRRGWGSHAPQRRLDAVLLMGVAVLGLVGCDPAPGTERRPPRPRPGPGRPACRPGGRRRRGPGPWPRMRRRRGGWGRGVRSPGRRRPWPRGGVGSCRVGDGVRRGLHGPAGRGLDRGVADQRGGRVRARAGDQRRAVLLPSGGAPDHFNAGTTGSRRSSRATTRARNDAADLSTSRCAIPRRPGC